MVVKFVVDSRVVNTKYITRKEKMLTCLVAALAVIFAPHEYKKPKTHRGYCLWCIVYKCFLPATMERLKGKDGHVI